MAQQLKDLEISEISIVDRPANKGAVIMLRKNLSGDASTSQEGEMASKEMEAIVKALTGDPDRMAVVRKGLRSGAITIEKIAAELQLEAIAVELRKREPSLTPEQAYVRVFKDVSNKDLVAKLYP
jgi:hypothetical protein